MDEKIDYCYIMVFLMFSIIFYYDIVIKKLLALINQY